MDHKKGGEEFLQSCVEKSESVRHPVFNGLYHLAVITHQNKHFVVQIIIYNLQYMVFKFILIELNV